MLAEAELVKDEKSSIPKAIVVSGGKLNLGSDLKANDS